MLSSRGRSSFPVGLDHPLAVVELHLTSGTGSMGEPTTDDAMAMVNGKQGAGGRRRGSGGVRSAVSRTRAAGGGGGRRRSRSSAAVAVCGVWRAARWPVVGGTVPRRSPRLCARADLPPAPRLCVSTRAGPSVMAQAPRQVLGRPRPVHHTPPGGGDGIGRRPAARVSLAAHANAPFSPLGRRGAGPPLSGQGMEGAGPTRRRWGGGLVQQVRLRATFTVSWVPRAAV